MWEEGKNISQMHPPRRFSVEAILELDSDLDGVGEEGRRNEGEVEGREGNA